MRDITKSAGMLEIQGDKVLAVAGKETAVFTIMRQMDEGAGRLMLVSRESKTQPRDEFPLTQEMADKLEPLKDPKVKDPTIKWRLML